MLTQERLKELLHYDPETGVFTWIIRASQKVYIGDIAGTLGKEGYVNISIAKKKYKAHRLAWLYVYGEWPNNIIDHINRIKNDNSIKNIRTVTVSENIQNQIKARSDNKSGMLGAYIHKTKNGTIKYGSHIRKNGKSTFLGLFDTPEMANLAYLEAKKIFHPIANMRAERQAYGA